MAKNLIGLYKENAVFDDIKFLNIEWRPWYFLTNFEGHFGLHASVILLDPNSVYFPSHLYVALIPKYSGQLAELIVHIIPLE